MLFSLPYKYYRFIQNYGIICRNVIEGFCRKYLYNLFHLRFNLKEKDNSFHKSYFWLKTRHIKRKNKILDDFRLNKIWDRNCGLTILVI